MTETTWLEVKISKALYDEFRQLLFEKEFAKGAVEDVYDIIDCHMEAPVTEALRRWIDAERAAADATAAKIREAELQIAANAAKLREDKAAIHGDIGLMAARCIACNCGIYITETVVEITTAGRQRLLHEDCFRRLRDVGLVGFSPDWHGLKPRRGTFSASGDYPPYITLR